MAEVTSLVVVKEFTYRDDTAEEWSNRYFLTGTPPQSSNGWKTLADGFIDVERACYAPSSKVVRAYGYDDNALDAHSVWGWDYDGAGTSLPGLLVSGAGEHPYAGDQAGLVWWKVDRKTSKGKYIYLRKFFHDGFLGAGKDVIGSTTNAAYDAFATTLATTGTGVGGRWIRSRIQDEVVLNHDGSAWVTTRTLKKRGKRPLKPAAPGLA